MVVSIHLMLLFIECWTGIKCQPTIVSIHLMLLFIQRSRSRNEHKKTFQYISCYSLSNKKRISELGKLVSIHLMLLFIYFPIVIPASVFPFQYISCYSLSDMVRYYKDVEPRFQYISCYSLSLYFTAFLTPNIFIIPQNTMHCKIFTRRLDNSLFWGYCSRVSWT